MFDELKELQDKMKNEESRFPYDCCSTIVKYMCNELGFLPEAGIVKTIFGDKKHSWAVKEGMLGDLTLFQFRDCYFISVPEIIYIPKEEAIAKYDYVKDDVVTRLLERYVFPPKKSLGLRGYFSI